MNFNLFKSTINGIGSGAGVAWPFFGIVFTLIGDGIGSITSLALGAVALSLFLSICSAIVYFSYQQTQEEQLSFKQQLKKHKSKILKDTELYLQLAKQAYACENPQLDFKDYFSLKLQKDINSLEKNPKGDLLTQYLTLLKEKSEKLPQTPSAKSILKGLPQILPPLSYKKSFIAAFFDFVGTFGSIAGCSAGFFGMLTGVGLFTSFAAFPILGWSVIALALTGGFFAATQAFKLYLEQSQKSLLSNICKEIHKELHQLNEQKYSDEILYQPSNTIKNSQKQTILSLVKAPENLLAQLNFFTPSIKKTQKNEEFSESKTAFKIR